MNSQTEMTLKLFGALRQYGNHASINLSIPKACSVSDLRKYLGEHLQKTHPEFKDEALLKECAFATSERVLEGNEMIPQVSFIAVLPPVCGG